jgi:hypothetical protein
LVCAFFVSPGGACWARRATADIINVKDTITLTLTLRIRWSRCRFMERVSRRTLTNLVSGCF